MTQESYIICLDVEHCHCGDVGFLVIPDSDGEPMQQQCEFCYTTPWSAFNIHAIKSAYIHRNEIIEHITEDNLPF